MIDQGISDLAEKLGKSNTEPSDTAGRGPIHLAVILLLGRLFLVTPGAIGPVRANASRFVVCRDSVKRHHKTHLYDCVCHGPPAARLAPRHPQLAVAKSQYLSATWPHAPPE